MLNKAQRSPLRVRCNETRPHGDSMRSEGNAGEKSAVRRGFLEEAGSCWPTELSAFVSSRLEIPEFDSLFASLG